MERPVSCAALFDSEGSRARRPSLRPRRVPALKHHPRPRRRMRARPLCRLGACASMIPSAVPAGSLGPSVDGLIVRVVSCSAPALPTYSNNARRPDARRYSTARRCGALTRISRASLLMRLLIHAHGLRGVRGRRLVGIPPVPAAQETAAAETSAQSTTLPLLDRVPPSRGALVPTPTVNQGTPWKVDSTKAATVIAGNGRQITEGLRYTNRRKRPARTADSGSPQLSLGITSAPASSVMTDQIL